MTRFRITLALLLLLLGFVACSSPSADPAGEVVQEFYGAINDGKYEQALTHYESGLRQTLSTPESGFGEWAASESKQGSIAQIDVESVESVGEEKSVTYQIRYADGSVANRSVSLTQDNGSWKLGFIR